MISSPRVCAKDRAKIRISPNHSPTQSGQDLLSSIHNIGQKLLPEFATANYDLPQPPRTEIDDSIVAATCEASASPRVDPSLDPWTSPTIGPTNPINHLEQRHATIQVDQESWHATESQRTMTSTIDTTSTDPENPKLSADRPFYQRLRQAVAYVAGTSSLFPKSVLPFSRSTSCALIECCSQNNSHLPPDLNDVDWERSSSAELTSSSGNIHMQDDYESVLANATSPDIYLGSWNQDLFIGKLLGCPPPVAMSNRWHSDIKVRLVGDIHLASLSLPRSLARDKTIVELEFCMTGTRSGLSDVVEMKPTVLIRCGSRRCQRAVANAVKELGYLKAFSRDRIILHHRPPRLANSPGVVHDSAKHASDTVSGNVSFKVRVPMHNSACGLQVKVQHLDKSYDCTIGGLIRVNDRVYGLTTAHGILQFTKDALSGASMDSESGSDSDYDSGSDDGFTDTDEASEEEKSRRRDNTAPRTEHILLSLDQNRDWTHAALGPCSYAGGLRLDGSNAYTLFNASDFALIEVAEDLSNLPNDYLSGSMAQRIESVSKINGTLLGHDDSQSVSIICSYNDVRKAHLPPGRHQFLQGSVLFSTRKIELDCLLKRGSSGVWVVQGARLIGLIVAVYDYEPYAHMLDVETVFQGIYTLLGETDPRSESYVGLQTTTCKHSTLSAHQSAPTSDDSSYLRLNPWLVKDNLRHWRRPLCRKTSTVPTDITEQQPQHRVSEVHSNIDPIYFRNLVVSAIILLAHLCFYSVHAMLRFLFHRLFMFSLSIGHVRSHANFFRILLATTWSCIEVAYFQSASDIFRLHDMSSIPTTRLTSSLAESFWLFVLIRVLTGVSAVTIITASTFTMIPVLESRTELSGLGTRCMTVARDNKTSAAIDASMGEMYYGNLICRWLLYMNLMLSIVIIVLASPLHQGLILKSLGRASKSAFGTGCVAMPDACNDVHWSLLLMPFMMGILLAPSSAWASHLTLVLIFVSAWSWCLTAMTFTMRHLFSTITQRALATNSQWLDYERRRAQGTKRKNA